MIRPYYKEDCFWHFEYQDHNAIVHGCDRKDFKGILDPDCLCCQHYLNYGTVKKLIRGLMDVSKNEVEE